MKTYPFNQEWKKSIRTVDDLSRLLLIPKGEIIAVSNNADKYFHEKKEGKRTFLVPSMRLKVIQRAILKHILNMEFNSCVQGGLKGRSIITNAQKHTNKKWVGCFDIKKFFPNSHFKNVSEMYSQLGCSSVVSKVLTQLTTCNYQLPQGSPVSPVISNLLVTKLDLRLSGLFKKAHLDYTRYFDDITVSGASDPGKYLDKLKLIVKQEGYSLHSSKEKLKIQKSPNEQIVTGLVVNSLKLNLPMETRNKIAETISNFNDGYFSKEYLLNPEKEKRSLEGLVSFIRSVNKSAGESLSMELQKIVWPHE